MLRLPCGNAVLRQCHVWQAAVPHFEFQLEFIPQWPVTTGPIFPLIPSGPRVTLSLASHSPRGRHRTLALSLASPRHCQVAPPPFDNATPTTGLLPHHRWLLKLLGGAVSSRSSPIRENQRYNPRTIPIYAMEIFRLWILLFGSSVDGLKVGSMINLNRYGDSLVEWNLHHA